MFTGRKALSCPTEKKNKNSLKPVTEETGCPKSEGKRSGLMIRRIQYSATRHLLPPIK
jgi:hypothetical protein